MAGRAANVLILEGEDISDRNHVVDGPINHTTEVAGNTLHSPYPMIAL